ncbi:MAG: amino acid ABC transporter permease [Castellaniella sp.]|uniref:amino acid ABC transporter permease n=1 Tax=Castellaniella sp. TaxID=1955812 RepID=UPI0012003E40|nr:amino acid ABC transporter permease [Castellaniella sp.]TAN28088.1 MAG: amino acid ABC transporter permease [Castellaniella sp.]
MLDLLTAQGALNPFYAGVLRASSVTILTSVAAFCIGLVIGTFLLFIRSKGPKSVKLLVRLYVSLMRGTPLLIQLLIAYYVVPSVLGLELSPIQAGILAMALNTAAYISEVLRGALTTIPRGQGAAADSLGMSHWTTWLYILLPQVFHRSLPPLTNEFTILLKASSLLSIISVSELSALARDANLQSNLPLQVFAAAAAVYFIILFCASSLSRLVERKIARVLPNAR